MPKVPTYTLAWSPVAATYELYQTRNREMLKIIPDSPAWFAWLDQVSSFAFSGKSSHYTARKEAKQRGGRYWSAYLATGEHLTKKYLGKTADLTLTRLEHIAGILRTQSAAQVPLHSLQQQMRRVREKQRAIPCSLSGPSSHSKAELMSLGFWPPLAAVIALCSTTSPTRCSRGSRRWCRRFCCTPVSWSASVGRSVMR